MFHCGRVGCPGHFRSSEKCPNPEPWKQYHLDLNSSRGQTRKNKLSGASGEEKPDFWKLRAPRPDPEVNLSRFRRAVDIREPKKEIPIVERPVNDSRRATEKIVFTQIVININQYYFDCQCPDHFSKKNKDFSFDQERLEQISRGRRTRREDYTREKRRFSR